MDHIVVSLRAARGQRPQRPQRGAVVIIFALCLVVMLAMFGLSLDLGQLYNRKGELQSVADSAALAAARELNGTSAGVRAALGKAAAAAARLNYQYNGKAVSWDDAAISFGTTAAGAGGWTDAGTAQGNADGLLFAKVDTSKLDAQIGAVNTIVMRILSASLAVVNLSSRAVAGRTMINLTPLGVCAQSASAGAKRINPAVSAANNLEELVEFGFRRGVAYDLMKLNPNGATADNFVLNPIDAPGQPASAANTAAAVVAPFVCTGSMPLSRVSPLNINVARPFPLAQLYEQLNARFDLYTGAPACVATGAPPDFNIKSYPYTSIAWMTTAPAGQSAATLAGPPLQTVADPLPAPVVAASAYGPLWSYAKPAKWAAYTAGLPEPAAGYATFATSDWAVLYKPGPVAVGYPGNSPYLAGGSSYQLSPSADNKPGLRNRRVLNVALLACPVAAGSVTSASVLGIGKFFMTVPATATSLNAEFAGVVAEQSLGGAVELSP